jgi:hypothetical protein
MSKGHVPDATGPKAPWECAPSPTRSPPCEGGGDWSRSRVSRPVGLAAPHLAPLVLSFIRRCPGACRGGACWYSDKNSRKPCSAASTHGGMQRIEWPLFLLSTYKRRPPPPLYRQQHLKAKSTPHLSNTPRA